MNDILKSHNIHTRPKINDGYWLMLLLPLAIITSSVRHAAVLTPTYKLAAVLSLGLLVSSAIFWYNLTKHKQLNIFNVSSLIAAILVTGLIHVCFEKGLLFTLFAGGSCTVIYLQIYLLILQKFPKCFSMGEASIAAQALSLLLFFATITLTNVQKVYMSSNQISTAIIQIGLLGLGIIALATYKFNIKNPVGFYCVVIFVLLFVIFLPLHVVLKRSPVLWMLELLLGDFTTIKLMIYWVFCTVLATVFVNKQVIHGQKASTGTRKIFHILAVAVYLPGLLYRCSILYLASGVVFGIFFALEILRNFQMPPLGMHLQDGFAVFSDEKDTGILALTAVYLLVGCSLPLWIHPAPCDVTDSALFNLLPLLSGLLAIGVGDTCASVIGSHFGKHHWKDSKKTIEGTVVMVLSQFLIAGVLVSLGFIRLLSEVEIVRVIVAVVVGSIVEAKTDQVDNLVLPFLMYIILV